MPRLKSMPSRLASAPSRLRPPPKVADPFYQSKEWRTLVARRKLDSDYFAAKARCKPGERPILDHINELKDGGDRLDPGNTQWLTFGEHQAKTARAKARRAGR